jgi:ferredoxin
MATGEPDFFSVGLEDTAKVKSYEPDREEVRRELLEVLEAAKAAIDECPWDERTFQYHKVVFPQMANWLPGDERDQMRFEFAREVERIELLLAA